MPGSAWTGVGLNHRGWPLVGFSTVDSGGAGVDVPTGVGAGEKADLHGLLLRLAGKAPDPLLMQCRAWLADGRVDELVRSVAFLARSQRVALVEDDFQLLGTLLADRGRDAWTLPGVDIVQFDPPPPFVFAANPAGTVTRSTADTAPADDVDRAAVAAVQEAAGVRGLWRAWRSTVDDAPWPPPRKVYAVEAEPGVDVVALTARLQWRLSAAGEIEPQVETFPTGAELPAYQALAVSYGALLWASTPAQDVQIAFIFDDVDLETGPRFDDAHERIDDAEEARLVADYLNAGEVLLLTTAMMDDVVDPSRRDVVPMNFRTDGRWVWTDCTTYYLEQHGLAPDLDLLAHIRASGYRVPPVDGVAAHRAIAALQSYESTEDTSPP